MDESNVIARTTEPLTLAMMIDQLHQLGLASGQTVLVHSSLSNLGYVSGGAQTVIMALTSVLGDQGTLMMPTHNSGNSDPANWRYPPVPESWWQTLRDNRPAYDPYLTPTRQMGIVPEIFRNLPAVIRSGHPVGSFAARGLHADYLTADHTSLEAMFSEGSPIGKLYELDGSVLLLGVPHSNNTSIHLAEYRADFPGKTMIQEGCAMMVNGKRAWVEFQMMNLTDDDFDEIGADYEREHPIAKGYVGLGESRFMKQRPLVDFAVDWMNTKRV